MLSATRIASKPARLMRKPMICTSRVFSTTMPLPPGSLRMTGFWPAALMIAFRPIRLIGRVTTACVW